MTPHNYASEHGDSWFNFAEVGLYCLVIAVSTLVALQAIGMSLTFIGH